MTVTIGFAAASAEAFVVTVVAATTLVAISHPDAPASLAGAGGSLPRAVMTLSFSLGLLSLLASLGLSGWALAERGLDDDGVASLGAALIVAVTVRVR